MVLDNLDIVSHFEEDIESVEIIRLSGLKISVTLNSLNVNHSGYY